MPANRAKIGMSLAAKITVVHLSKEAKGVGPRLCQSSAELLFCDHSPPLRSSRSSCQSNAVSKATMSSSGTPVQSSPSQSLSEATTPARGKIFVLFAEYKDGAGPLLAKREATIHSPSVTARFKAKRMSRSSPQESS